MRQRILTAIILLVIFMPIAIFGGIPFLLLAYIMATIGLYELFQMRNLSVKSFHGGFSLFLLWLFMLPSKYFNVINVTDLTKMEFLFIGVLIFLIYTVIVKNTFNFNDVGFALLSVLYIGIGFYYFVETRNVGLVFLLYALFVIWATDSGAYFIGRKFGRRKLWPEISPNKTIGGFIGGIVSALIVAILFFAFTNIATTVSFITLMIITVIISIFGQLGDLVESALKRHYGVKDSGRIFPGHGGILDRCDSWLFVLPLLNFLYNI